jgi:hypothetical protein
MWLFGMIIAAVVRLTSLFVQAGRVHGLGLHQHV